MRNNRRKTQFHPMFDKRQKSRTLREQERKAEKNRRYDSV